MLELRSFTAITVMFGSTRMDFLIRSRKRKATIVKELTLNRYSRCGVFFTFISSEQIRTPNRWHDRVPPLEKRHPPPGGVFPKFRKHY